MRSFDIFNEQIGRIEFAKKNTHGKILDVVVDLRKNSKTFGKTFKIEMSENSDFSLFIPEGFAHGFLCKSNECVIYYKCSNYRNKN